MPSTSQSRLDVGRFESFSAARRRSSRCGRCPRCCGGNQRSIFVRSKMSSTVRPDLNVRAPQETTSAPRSASPGCWRSPRGRALDSASPSDPYDRSRARSGPSPGRGAALLQRLLEGKASDRHRLADRLHLRGERFVSVREFLECPAWDLDHDVVDRRLEAGQRLAGDVVLELVEPSNRPRAWRRSSRSGKPVAFGGQGALDRTMRGSSSSMTIIRPPCRDGWRT